MSAGHLRLPALTTAQMREVDRLMTQELRISMIQMMENAGRHLADLAIARYRPSSCTVLAGPGGNGGGGLVAARHLHNRGVAVTVVTFSSTLTGAGSAQLDILRRMGVATVDEPPPASLVIDALVGLFEHWNDGTVIRSWLIELMAKALREHPSQEALSPYVEDTGEAKWVLSWAADQDIRAPVTALSQQMLMAYRDRNSPTAKAAALLRYQFGGHPLHTDEIVTDRGGSPPVDAR